MRVRTSGGRISSTLPGMTVLIARFSTVPVNDTTAGAASAARPTSIGSATTSSPEPLW
jgi:hypothetical protein